MEYNLEKHSIETIKDILKSDAILYCLISLVIIKLLASIAVVNFPYNPFFGDITKSNLEALINQARADIGLKALTQSATLRAAAEMKANDMIKNQYFSHNSPTGITPWHWFSKAGYKYKYAGENLAIGFFDSVEVYQAWIHSPSHKANIINAHYQEMGTAVVSGFGEGNSIVVVQLFGSPAVAVQPAPASVPTLKTPVTEATLQVSELVSIPAVEGSFTPEPLNRLTIMEYNQFLQDIGYGVSLVTIGMLMTLTLFGFKNREPQFEPRLAFRCVLIGALLSCSLLTNAQWLTLSAPHYITI